MSKMERQTYRDISLEGSSRRAVGIDGIRGLVAVIIALFHLEFTFKFASKAVFSTGYLGVEFFLVLSGFLLAKELSDKFILGTDNIGTIFKKKLMRLYPAYLIALLAIGLVFTAKWFGGNFFAWLGSENHISDFVVEALCLQATGLSGFRYINYPAWYVSGLIISSIIIMPLIKYGKAFFSKWVAPSVSILLYVIFVFKGPSFMSPNNIWMGFIPTAIMRSLAGMLCGVYLYSVYLKAYPKIRSFNNLKVSVIEGFSLLCFFMFLLFRQSSRWDYLVLLPICILIVMMFSSEGIFSQILALPPFRYLGTISYYFYILQSFCSNVIICWFSKLHQPYITFVYFALNIVSAVLLYFFIEFLFPTSKHKCRLHIEFSR